MGVLWHLNGADSQWQAQMEVGGGWPWLIKYAWAVQWARRSPWAAAWSCSGVWMRRNGLEGLTSIGSGFPRSEWARVWWAGWCTSDVSHPVPFPYPSPSPVIHCHCLLWLPLWPFSVSCLICQHLTQHTCISWLVRTGIAAHYGCVAWRIMYSMVWHVERWWEVGMVGETVALLMVVVMWKILGWGFWQISHSWNLPESLLGRWASIGI